MMTRKEAKEFIESFVKLRELATDEMLMQVPNICPTYKKDKKYKENDRVMHEGKLHRVTKDNKIQEVKHK